MYLSICHFLLSKVHKKLNGKQNIWSTRKLKGIKMLEGSLSSKS